MIEMTGWIVNCLGRSEGESDGGPGAAKSFLKVPRVTDK
jgi:hypothetical protein